MQDNIYVVFSGGDDCFMIGSWNHIFDLAVQLRKEFSTFQEKIKKKFHLYQRSQLRFQQELLFYSSLSLTTSV